MSRSYKHTRNVVSFTNKWAKKWANRSVRHTKDIPVGGKSLYKRLYESYEIKEVYGAPSTLEQFMRYIFYKSPKEAKRDYIKYYVRK